MPRRQPRPDVAIHNHGTIVVIVPETPAAREWCADNLGPDVLRWGDGIACEPRYVEDIADGLQAEGFTVEGF